MKRVLKTFFGGLTVLILFVGGYELYKVSPKEFFPDSLTFAYVNEDLKNMDIEDFLKFLDGEGYYIDENKVREIQKNIDGIYMIETTPFLNPNKEPVFILDVGFRYFLYYLKIKEYFNFTGKNYVLKSKYMEDLNFEKLGIEELYMRPYKGNYLFSKNPQKIEQIINERTAMSDESKKFFKNMEYGNLGIIIFNFKRERVYGLDALSIIMNYGKGELDFYSTLTFSELEIQIPENGYKNNLERYIGENILYVRIKDYVKAYDIARRYIKRDEKIEFLINFWQDVLGVDILRLLEDIDQELVYDFQRESGIVKFKNRDRIDKVVSWTNYRNNIGLETSLELEGRYLYIGDKRLIPSDKNLEKLKKNQIIYYNRKMDGEKIDFQVYNFQNAFKIKGRINDKVLSNLIKKIENYRKEK